MTEKRKHRMTAALPALLCLAALLAALLPAGAYDEVTFEAGQPAGTVLWSAPAGGKIENYNPFTCPVPGMDCSVSSTAISISGTPDTPGTYIFGTTVRHTGGSEELSFTVVVTAASTATPAGTPSPTATPRPSPTGTPVPTDTPEPGLIGMPVSTETPPPSPTDTPLPTETPEPAPAVTPVPTATPPPSPTDTPVPTATSAAPTDTPAPAPTPEPAPAKDRAGLWIAGGAAALIGGAVLFLALKKRRGG